MNTTVYSNGPSCGGCIATGRSMERHGVPHAYVLLTKGDTIPAPIQALIEDGEPIQAPFVVTTDDDGQIIREHSWSTYRPDKIKALAGAMEKLAA